MSDLPVGRNRTYSNDAILAQDISAVRTYAEGKPDWGGLRIEPGSPPTIIVFFTSDVEAHVHALAQLVQRPEQLQIEACSSDAELLAIRKQLEPLLESLAEKAGLMSWSVSIVSRHLEVCLPLGGEAVAAKLVARFGVVVRPCFGNWNGLVSDKPILGLS